jgi:FdhD protein
MSHSTIVNSPAIAHLPVQKIKAASRQETDDTVAVEEPLEIRLQHGPAGKRVEQGISVTMRTPGQDSELATGFLFTEGIIADTSAIVAIEQKYPSNSIRIELHEQVVLDLGRLQRHFYTSSSCGVCGKSSIDALKTVCPAPAIQKEEQPLEAGLLYSLPTLLRQEQNIFDSTGGLHASALFGLKGNLACLREDIGRHNALDKLIGYALQEGLLPLDTHILLLSGRACFELIQKAAMAGIKIVAAVGPPSSLAVQLAEEQDMTLVGFLRQERFNIYSGAHRIRI